MPVLFMGHGSPMNAIEENEFSLPGEKLANSSRHPGYFEHLRSLETPSPQVTAMKKPKPSTYFYGFPRELNEMVYPAPVHRNWLNLYFNFYMIRIAKRSALGARPRHLVSTGPVVPQS
jgi:aromatic ring-opening dioxygenase catalytic subunit (LigB family)